MGNKTPGLEIERKFLISMPDQKWLSLRAVDVMEIRQTYLSSQNRESARVRQITKENNISYIHTVKRRISDLKREESEREITKEEYESLLQFADKARRTIEKMRYCLPQGKHILEIDIFPFWKDKAFLEIELSEETEAFSLPREITVIREVTEDGRYTNAALARKLPEE